MLIGITGHARHGKDTTADFIVKHFGFRKVALADNMKRACKIIFPNWTDDYLWGDHKDEIDPEWGISARHALQELGTGFGQYGLAKYDDFAGVTGRLLWTRSTLAGIGEHENVVISDVRFPHEAEEIRRRGGVILKVHRNKWPINLEHESERGIDEIAGDWVIFNRGTLGQLEAETMHAMRSLVRVGLDIDDVLADFIGAYCRRYELPLPRVWEFDPYFEARYKNTMQSHVFWATLKPKFASHELDGLNVACYITSRPDALRQWTQEWIEAAGLPAAPIKFVGPDGSKIDAARAHGVDVFIDDRPENVRDLNRAGIMAYMMDATHNRDVTDLKRIYKIADIFA